MEFKQNSELPIFAQVANMVEIAILQGAFAEETQVPSIADFAVMYKINPGTALKGITALVDENVLYKKRGIGMFVASGAVQKLQAKRQKEFDDNTVDALVIEAKTLGLTLEQIQKMIANRY